jgi:hypothetical protein
MDIVAQRVLVVHILSVALVGLTFGRPASHFGGVWACWGAHAHTECLDWFGTPAGIEGMLW